jgi:Flp pilus assembly pilin Flp
MGAIFCARVRRLLGGDEAGQDLIEYALLVALIVLVAVTALTEVGSTIRDVFWAVIAASIPEAPA